MFSCSFISRPDLILHVPKDNYDTGRACLARSELDVQEVKPPASEILIFPVCLSRVSAEGAGFIALDRPPDFSSILLVWLMGNSIDKSMLVAVRSQERTFLLFQLHGESSSRPGVGMPRDDGFRIPGTFFASVPVSGRPGVVPPHWVPSYRIGVSSKPDALLRCFSQQRGDVRRSR